MLGLDLASRELCDWLARSMVPWIANYIRAAGLLSFGTDEQASSTIDRGVDCGRQ
jgi:hypothetical protein